MWLHVLMVPATKRIVERKIIITIIILRFAGGGCSTLSRDTRVKILIACLGTQNNCFQGIGL